MAVTIKSKKEIELMREAGKMLEEVHNKLADFVKPGISTLEIDQFGEKAIRDLGCVPNFLNYNGYPASICVSVNDEVVHGIPSKDRILQDGDIVSLDAGLIHEGYHSDAARTHAVGNISEEAKRLIEVTKQSFFEGIKLAVPGNHLFDISEAIQKYVESNGYSVVRDLVGHGIVLKEPSSLMSYALIKPSFNKISAIAVFILEAGISTVSCFAVFALRILVSISAIGSLIVIFVFLLP